MNANSSNMHAQNENLNESLMKFSKAKMLLSSDMKAGFNVGDEQDENISPTSLGDEEDKLHNDIQYLNKEIQKKMYNSKYKLPTNGNKENTCETATHKKGAKSEIPALQIYDRNIKWQKERQQMLQKKII